MRKRPSPPLLLVWLQILHGLRSYILERINLLHKLTDNLALLDMLCAFAAAVAESGGGGDFVRPQLTDNGPLAIVQVGTAWLHLSTVRDPLEQCICAFVPAILCDVSYSWTNNVQTVYHEGSIAGHVTLRCHQ